MSSDREKDHSETVLKALDESLEKLSDSDLARLESARMNALNAIPASASVSTRRAAGNSAWPKVWTGLSLASVLFAALVFLQLRHPERTAEEHIELSVQEVEWIMSTDDFEVLTEDLDFYAWLGAELDRQNTES